jgi:hypothetical protein
MPYDAAQAATRATVPDGLMSYAVRLDTSAEHLNAIANHPEVRPFIGGGDGEVDVTPLLADSYFLVTDLGGFIFQRKFFGRYVLHTMFLPEGRGKHVAEVAKDAFLWMFTHTDAEEISTYTEHGRKEARPPRSMGWRDWFEDETYTHYRLNMLDWAPRAPRLMEWGEWLSGLTPAEMGDVQRRYAGLSAAMCVNGHAAKGVFFYNRWAEAAGFALAHFESESPLVINSSDALWAIDGQKIEVTPCQ